MQNFNSVNIKSLFHLLYKGESGKAGRKSGEQISGNHTQHTQRYKISRL